MGIKSPQVFEPTSGVKVPFNTTPLLTGLKFKWSALVPLYLAKPYRTPVKTFLRFLSLPSPLLAQRIAVKAYKQISPSPGSITSYKLLWEKVPGHLFIRRERGNAPP